MVDRATATTGASLPEPLTSPDCDLRAFATMPLDATRLFGSEFHAVASDAAWRAGVTLWLRSWHQVPAASLPDDDVQLARLAEFGRDVKAWRRVREQALHGWTLCNDGRLYHPVVAEKAAEAWAKRQAFRERSAKGNQKRWGSDKDKNNYPKPILEGSTKDSLNDPKGEEREGKGIELETSVSSVVHGPATDNPAMQPPGPAPTTAPTRDDVSVAFDQFQAMRAGSRPNCRPIALTPKRRAALARRLTEVGGLPGWAEVLARIRGSALLRGDKSEWAAEIDWLIKPENLTKVMEGNYDDRSSTPAAEQPRVRHSPIDALSVAIAASGLGG